MSPLAEMLRGAIGIRTADSADAERVQAREWIDQLWPELSPERERAHEAVCRLLALDDTPAPIEQGVLFSAWRAVLEREAARVPLPHDRTPPSTAVAGSGTGPALLDGMAAQSNSHR